MRQKNRAHNSKSESSASPSTEVGSTLIGSGSSVKGELAGDEDLLIQGQFEGTIDLKKNQVTIGKSGCLKADVYGKTITIEGTVEGNLFGGERIVLRQSASVRGNMMSPRVKLEDGAKFQGNVDMDFQDRKQQPSLKEVPLAKVHSLSRNA